MREYVLIWRALPKFCIGTAFAVELLVALFGRGSLVSLLEAAKSITKALFSGATLLIALILLLVIVAGLGLLLLDVLSTLIRRAVKKASLLLPRGWLVSVAFGKLISNPYTIAMEIFKDRGEFYLDYLSLKSTSVGLENLEKSTEIRGYTSLVNLHLKNARPTDIESMNFYGMLEQDRRVIEIILDEIQMLENLVIVLLLAPILLRSIFDTPAELLSMSIGLGAGFLLLPEIADRKLFLGGVLLTSYLDYFVIHEGVEVADREGEPRL
ncbi:MAG TPA: hypothetical protein VGS07_14960 [Thermoanaerobaculia bacterium]|jgi:hypothetical protein|nr:hypothetical protein [Thermoanaerobaculia bacterium]